MTFRCRRWLAVTLWTAVVAPSAPRHPGDLLWRTRERATAAPAWSDTTVYFFTARHALVALDRHTGAPRWASHTGGDTTSPGPGQNVVVAGPNVVVPDGALYAFDRERGTLRWRFAPASGDEPGRFTIAADGDAVYAGSARGLAYAVDAGSGAPRWSTFIAGAGTTVAHPVLSGDLVLYSVRRWTSPTSGGVVALDRRTGALRWARRFVASTPDAGAGSYGRAGVWGDRVIASADDGTLYALRRTDGETLWTAPRPADERTLNDQRPVAVIGDVVVAGSERARLDAYDVRTGAHRWTLASPSGSASYELGHDRDRAYLVSAGLRLHAIDARTGRILWSRGTRPIGQFLPFPVSDDSAVFVPAVDGMYAFRR